MASNYLSYLLNQQQNVSSLFLVVLSLLGINNTLTAGVNYSFKNYNINDGLSHNTVFSIFQDKQGFMWFGTKDGLNRFDGSSFKVYKSPADKNLSDNVFRHIIQYDHDKIWLATDNGVTIYDPLMERFTVFDKKSSNNKIVQGIVSDMIIDHAGDIWMAVASEGLFRYDHSADSLHFYAIPLVADGIKLMSLCADDEGGIWVFSYSSPLVKIDRDSGTISTFQLKDDTDFLFQLGIISKVLYLGNNQFILCTSQKGVVEINTATKSHRVLVGSDEEENPIFARCMEKVDANTLWIGTESGLYIYNLDTGEVIEVKHVPFIATSLSDNAIYSIFKDREGGIWIGSYFGGVDYYSKEQNRFALYYPLPYQNSLQGLRVREFCEASDGKIWIGTEDGGLNLFDPVDNSFLTLPGTLQSIHTNIHALYQDGDLLWIGTFSKGLLKYHLVTGELVTYKHAEDVSQNSAFAIYKDKQDLLWVGTLSGLNIYSNQKDDFIRVDEFIGIGIQDIFEDSAGNLWISTLSEGLYQLNPTTSHWKVFLNDPDDPNSLPYNKVTSVFEDRHRTLWVTTQGGGFCRFNAKEETFTPFNSANGFPHDVVYQIEEDELGFLWLSTNAGLVRYCPETGLFKNYTVESGLKTNQFNYKSSYKSADGMLYFGSIDGFVRFNPAAFNAPNATISVVLTSLIINNVPVLPTDEKSLLEQSILFTEELTLPHYKNSFRMSCAILNYSNRNDYQLLYRLEGFDKEWIMADCENDIIYSNLKPGKYQLSLKLNYGPEAHAKETLKSLTIVIRPPFWLTGWAYLCYLILLIVSLLGLFRFLNYRNHTIQKENMRLFEQQKERELYRSKIDFFTSVAHEIRTPLSLIKAPLDHVIVDEEVSEEVKENLQIMSKNTDRLISLTNQLLDFQKTESDAYRIHLKSHNVSALLRETFIRFKPLARQRALFFEIDLPDEEMYVQVDKEAFLKIISNLLSNAIRYSDSFVKMIAYIAVENDNHWFHLFTNNDGEVIPEKYKQEVFKPFVSFDKESDSVMNGAGIGLALSRSLTELHQGTLELENDNDFTQFHLKLPVGKIITTADASLNDYGKRVTDDDSSKSDRAVVLLVDDDLELLQFEEKILSSHYHVLTALNGKDALRMLHQFNVNLIVTDIMMPEMDGFELTKHVKQNIESSHIPVILLTAKVNVESKVLGFDIGADAYIDKPFSLEVLMAQIANLLQNRDKLRASFLKNPFIGANSIVRTKSDEDFIEKLFTIVHENIDNSDFIVEDIAEQFNMSRASFYRKIKGLLNLTPNEYIRVERLKKAAKLLREKEYKVNEVCYMVGFNSASYFTKCFQQQFGVLPKDFA